MLMEMLINLLADTKEVKYTSELFCCEWWNNEDDFLISDFIVKI